MVKAVGAASHAENLGRGGRKAAGKQAGR
jgi:hypothetical protein